jgi:hypothetical protein
MMVWIEPWEIDCERAIKAKKHYLIQQQHSEEDQQAEDRRKLVPSPSERISNMLNKFEAGDLEIWWRPYFWVDMSDNGHVTGNEHRVDIRDLSAWKDSLEQERARIISAAGHYLRKHDVKPENWFFKKNILHYPAVGGFRALLLLGRERPDILGTLPCEVWEQWMPAVLRLGHSNELDSHRWLTAKAFAYAPDTAAEWAVKVIGEENKEGCGLSVLFKLPDVWEEPLGVALMERARRGRLKPSCFKELQEALFKHDVQGALELTRKKVRFGAVRTERGRKLALLASRLLMRYGQSDDWARVWKLINSDVSFGKELVEGFAHHYDHAPAGILKTMSESDVGQLWEWMLVQYPEAEDPEWRSSGTVTTRRAIMGLRNNLIVYLADLGTAAGCNELQRLIAKYPEFEWFRRILFRGQEQMRRLTWLPVTPECLFQFAKNQNARLVQSGEQLLAAIIDSLSVLQKELSGETPLAQYLWEGKRPKPEEPISDWIKIHLEKDLKQRGVVLDREVQIHRYDETDIHVTAVTKDPSETVYGNVKVIIEVKGAWNTGLKTAMKTQLVDRYLKDNDCRHGLYLVGWFDRNGWDDADYRKKQVQFTSCDELGGFLDKQAGEHSHGALTIKGKVIDFSVRQPASKSKKKGKK